MAHGLVFISYSRRDREYVDKLAPYLEGHGVNAWWDHEIDYGTKWENEIVGRLDEAECMVVVMSESSRQRPWVKREIDHAQRRKIPIYPILLEADGVIDALSELQFDNVIGGRKMPALPLCQKLPGFLANENDLMGMLSRAELQIAERLRGFIGPVGMGAEGPSVVALQTELIRVGLDPGEIDGKFAEKTRNAVREFQVRRSPMGVGDGSVGLLTASLLVNARLGDLAPPDEV